MSEFLMRRPRDLFTRNKQARRKLKRNQTVLIVPSDMMLTKARFGVLVKWKQIMYQRGLKAVRLQRRIVRCYARPIIGQKEIGNKTIALTQLMSAQQDKEGEKKAEQRPASIKITDEQNKKLDFFITAPLRSADRLMKQLYNDDHFYETTTYAWVGEKDAKKLFLYGVCKEVIKSCIGLTNDKEFLQEVPNHKEKEPDRMEKIISGGITAAQTYRIRKMDELLGFLILFDRNTKRDEEYRVFLSAENLDLALARQEDFRELYEGRIISNTKHSIDDYAKRIQDDLKTLGVQELWFLHKDRLKNLKPSVFASKKKLFLAALLVASADERLALGISYGRGYSRTSQSVHPLLGSHDYGKDDNNTKHIISNFSYLSIICMHIMHLAYKLAGVDDPEGITKMMGENFEKSEASKNIAQFKKEF